MKLLKWLIKPLLNEKGFWGIPAAAVPYIIQGGTSLLGSLLGGSKGRWEMSPEQRAMYNMLMGQYQSPGLPSFLTGPITRAGEQERAGIRGWFGSNLPQGTASGLELANLMRSGAGTQRAIGEAGSQYKSSLLPILSSLATGQQYSQEPNMMSRISGAMGGIGQAGAGYLGYKQQEDYQKNLLAKIDELMIKLGLK